MKSLVLWRFGTLETWECVVLLYVFTKLFNVFTLHRGIIIVYGNFGWVQTGRTSLMNKLCRGTASSRKVLMALSGVVLTSPIVKRTNRESAVTILIFFVAWIIHFNDEATSHSMPAMSFKCDWDRLTADWSFFFVRVTVTARGEPKPVQLELLE